MIGEGPTGRLAGFWECCCQASFSYLGCEGIGITANEAERPRESLPKAVRRISQRIIFYYLGAILVLGLNVSSNDPILELYMKNTTNSYSSPFVLMLKRAGLGQLTHVVNVVGLVALLSEANAKLYLTVLSFSFGKLTAESGSVCIGGGRARSTNIFEKEFSRGPSLGTFSVITTGSIGVLGSRNQFQKRSNLFIVLSDFQVFFYLSAMAVNAGLISWAVICATYLRFSKAVIQQHRISTLVPETKSVLQPYLALYGLIFSLVISPPRLLQLT